MPQAAFVPIFTSITLTGGWAVAAFVVQTILINIALGSLEYRDQDGELWIAVDD